MKQRCRDAEIQAWKLMEKTKQLQIFSSHKNDIILQFKILGKTYLKYIKLNL